MSDLPSTTIDNIIIFYLIMRLSFKSKHTNAYVLMMYLTSIFNSFLGLLQEKYGRKTLFAQVSHRNTGSASISVKTGKKLPNHGEVFITDCELVELQEINTDKIFIVLTIKSTFQIQHEEFRQDIFGALDLAVRYPEPLNLILMVDIY